MRHKILCILCGKKGSVEMDGKTGEILDKNWYYFGKMNINFMKTDRYHYEVVRTRPDLETKKVLNLRYGAKAKPKMLEHWECRECSKK